MSFALLCTALHPMIPAMHPGDRVGVKMDGDRLTLSFSAAAAGIALRRLAQAIHDGALVIHPGPPHPTFEDIEADVLARWLATEARIGMDPPAERHRASA